MASPSASSSSSSSSDESSQEEKLHRPPMGKQISMTDLLDRENPWVLVEGGSMKGYFDWVPVHLRVGPWHPLAICYLVALLCMFAMAAIWFHSNPPERGWMATFSNGEKYEPYTKSWYFNLAAFLWTLGISLDIMFNGALGAGAWATYTVQSWTFIMLRHGLCVLAPFWSFAVVPAELLRLPVLITACCTFVVWNFILAPAILLFFIKDQEKRRKFFVYFTNFRLTQLHVVNIFLAVANGALVHPRRELGPPDVYVVAVQLILYMIWYYCVLDRLGVHLYPIFSPRSPIVLVSWTGVICAYLFGYRYWQGFLRDAIAESKE